MARTPLKIVLVDRHRHRRLERTRAAALVAAAELVIFSALVAGVAVAADARAWVPLAIAAPLFAVELWFDARSRGRRLVPELCGAVGISAVVAVIVLLDDQSASLAAALWTLLAARAIASVTFARGQVLRLRTGASSTVPSDLAQLLGVAIAVVAWLVDPEVAVGALCVLAVIGAQFAWSRGPARPAKVIGFWQLGFGLAIVLGTRRRGVGMSAARSAIRASPYGAGPCSYVRKWLERTGPFLDRRSMSVALQVQAARGGPTRRMIFGASSTTAVRSTWPSSPPPRHGAGVLPTRPSGCLTIDELVPHDPRRARGCCESRVQRATTPPDRRSGVPLGSD